MADVKISVLPPGANAATPDFYPAVKGGVTVRITHAQLMTLIETALTKLLLSGGGISLNADGSAALGNGSVLVGVGGDLQVGAGAAVIQVDGSANFVGGITTVDGAGAISVGGQVQINADGSASFGSGLITMTSVGDINGENISAVSAVNGLSVNASANFICNSLAGITGDFSILVAGIPKTFHFEGGILTSVT